MDAERKVTLSRTSLHIRAVYESPAGEIESKIAELFAEALSIDRVGANDDFFDLGGDSLLGESLAASISQFIGRDFQISLLVSRNTPRKVASYLTAQVPELSTSGKRPPIFMVHGLGGYMLPRPEFLTGLAPGQTLRMFELPGIRGEKAPHTTIEAIASDYISQLYSEYPSGPILLGGFCRGSLITVEMAVQLEDLGRPVLQMVLFDPGNTPANVQQYFQRVALGELEKKDRGSRNWQSRRWYRQQFVRLKYLLAAGRWTDGSSAEDFNDEKIRQFRERQYKRELSGRRSAAYREKTKGLGLSLDAQAKLLAAYDHFLPRPFSGPVTIFASTRRAKKFQKQPSLWSYLLQNREIHELGKTHAEVIRASAATGARLMQATFDAAVDRYLAAKARNTQDLSDVS